MPKWIFQRTNTDQKGERELHHFVNGTRSKLIPSYNGFSKVFKVSKSKAFKNQPNNCLKNNPKYLLKNQTKKCPNNCPKNTQQINRLKCQKWLKQWFGQVLIGGNTHLGYNFYLNALEIKPCGLKFKNSRCLFLEL